MTRRQERINSLFRQLVSSFLRKEKTGGAIVTVTHVETFKDLKSAKIFVSIFPENEEKEIIDALKKKVGELRKFIGSQIKMKFLPHFEFEMDVSEKAQQKIDEILGRVSSPAPKLRRTNRQTGKK